MTLSPRYLASAGCILGACRPEAPPSSATTPKQGPPAEVRSPDTSTAELDKCANRAQNMTREIGCPPEWGQDVLSGLLAFERSIVSQVPAISDCFPDVAAEGRSVPLPPLSAKCNLAPDQHCRAVEPGNVENPWDYVLPSKDDVWQRFELIPEAWGTGDMFHKTLHWKVEDGECFFEIHARADLNVDGIFGLYTVGHVFPVGAKTGAPFERQMMTVTPERPGDRSSSDRPMFPH